MKTILVTGGTGFIGSNLAIKLLEEGHNVRILRREHSDLRAIGSIEVEHHIGNVHDKESVRRAMRGCDTVFHTAALISFWKKERALQYEINVLGTRNVAEAALELGVERFVHTSSIAAIGPGEPGAIADESTPFGWDKYDVGYNISKYESEREVKRGIEKGLPAVIVNPANVFGQRDIHFHSGGVIRDIKRGKVPFYVDTILNVVSVDDVVDGHLQAAKKGVVGERYILGGENLSVKQVLDIIADVVDGKSPRLKVPFGVASLGGVLYEVIGNILNQRPLITPELVRIGKFRTAYSSEKAKRELGYRITPFRRAVENSYRWYVENGFLT